MKLEPTEVSFLITLIQNDAGQIHIKPHFKTLALVTRKLYRIFCPNFFIFAGTDPGLCDSVEIAAVKLGMISL